MNVFPTKVEQNILEFILGGKAHFCIKQTVNGRVNVRWYTVKVNDKNKNMFFAYVVEDNKGKYLGYFYKNDVGKIKEFYVKNKLAEVDTSLGIPLIRVLNRLGTVGYLWDAVEVLSDGRCSVCGRRLTDLNSIKDGVGPECRKKLKSIFNT